MHGDTRGTTVFVALCLALECMPEPLDTRRKILDAAVAQIEAGGERSVRLREVARLVGIAEPTLYHYFPNRESLIVASQARRLRTSLAITIDPFLAAARQCSSREDFLNVLLGVYHHSYQPERAVVRAVRSEIIGNSFLRENLHVEVAEAINEALADSIDVLNYAQEKGWLPERVDTAAFAMFNLSLISSLVFPEIYGDGPLLEQWKLLAQEAVTSIMLRDD